MLFFAETNCILNLYSTESSFLPVSNNGYSVGGLIVSVSTQTNELVISPWIQLESFGQLKFGCNNTIAHVSNRSPRVTVIAVTDVQRVELVVVFLCLQLPRPFCTEFCKECTVSKSDEWTRLKNEFFWWDGQNSTPIATDLKKTTVPV